MRFFLIFLTSFFIFQHHLFSIPYIFVEGPMGVGKTTFVQMLKRNIPDSVVIYEPVELFINVNGAGNILDRYFADAQRWAFAAEIYITLMHAQVVEQCKANNKNVVIIDRSIYADYFVFAKMAYEAGAINRLEGAIYHELFWWIASKSIKPDGFIYLQADPAIILERIKTRNRVEEKNVSLAYQKNLDMYYTQWFFEKKDIPKDIAQIPLLVIDANKNFKDDVLVQQCCVEQVKDFIKILEG